MSLPIHQVILQSRPGPNNPPTDKNFHVTKGVLQYTDNDIVVKALYLSVDPALRCRMNESTGVGYLIPWQVNEVIEGIGGIGVIESVPENGCIFKKGDVVTSKSLKWPWQSYFIVEQDDLEVVPEELHDNLPLVFSCLGLIGLTVYLGIVKKAGLKSTQTEPNIPLTMVVSGAGGACGLLAGQIAKLEGAQRVIGICGSNEKCEIIKQFGYDEAINYKTQNVGLSLPKGQIHAYFDNVGGSISEAVVENMATNGNIVLCGQISQYNKDVPYPPPLSRKMMENLETKKIARDRFLVLNYSEEFKSSLGQLSAWIKDGKIKTRETIVHGIENAGKAFVDMMNGANIGKQLVKVA